MGSRLSAPDTDADIELRGVLDSRPLNGFTMIAGAGSGKTTSLIKALAHIVEHHGDELRHRTQKVACITYTEVGAAEIAEDVGNDPLVLVSTIHSFLWQLARPFQRDVVAWVRDRTDAQVAKLESRQQAASKLTSREAKDLDKYRSRKQAIQNVKEFTYGIASDYGRGVLGHEEILQMVPTLIAEKPLMAKLIGRKYPYIFVDESQDTFSQVVDSLKIVAAAAPGAVCLGFLGDPMQQIYTRGVGEIVVEEGWKEISKPENFRSSLNVLAVVNAVRAGADNLVQVSGLPKEEQIAGESHFFVLPADDKRSEHLERVRGWLDVNSSAGLWSDSEGGNPQVKILMILHRMAAKRLGFENMYAAFNDNKVLGDAFSDGNAWPLRPFSDVILPLVAANSSDRARAVELIRKRGTALALKESDAATVRLALADAGTAVSELKRLFSDGGAGSVGAVLRLALESGIVESDPRFLAYFGEDVPGISPLSTELAATLAAFFECDVRELSGYFRYINHESPYATHHGTKGSEFRKVIVVLDDDEGKRFIGASYDKLLKLKSLSDTDLKNQKDGKDSVLERTRRLLYVCVSRAEEALAVVLFASDVTAAVTALASSGMTTDHEILTLADIGG